MKRFYLFLITLSLLTACNKDKEVVPGSIEELKVQKTKISQQIDSLNAVLKTIDQQLARLDKSEKLQIVTVTEPEVTNFQHFIEMQGVVKADKNIDIRPELGGTIVNIFVKEGQRVQGGQLLMQLDDSAIQDNIAKINTQLELAKTTFERQKRLWDQKIGSEMQFLQAKTQYESLSDSKKALLTQADKMKIKAPFSGIIDEIFPKKGELASPQLPVIRLVNLSEVYVEADVTETYLPYVKAGNTAIVEFPSINTTVQSKISRVGNVINPSNRSFKTKIHIPNKKRLIKPNLLANIKIVDFEEKGIVIPVNLIQEDKEGNRFVYVAEEKGTERFAVKKLIEIASEYNHKALIKKGLNANDVLIVKGSRIVKNGDKIRIAG